MTPAALNEHDTAEQPALEPRLGLLGDIRDELHWTFTGRKGWLIGIAVNLVTAYIYLAITQPDPSRFGDIKAANVGLAVTLWCLADTVNTNQLGADRERVAASLEAGDSLLRILALKNLALAILLVPVALLLSLIHHIYVGNVHLPVHALLFDIGSVFLWQGVGSVISVLLPFRPLSIRARLKARKTWVRYGIAQAAPYVAIVLMVALHLPYVLLYVLRAFGPLHANFIDYALAYAAIGLAYWWIGLALASLWGRLFRADLIAALQREDWVRDEPTVSRSSITSAGAQLARRRR